MPSPLPAHRFKPALSQLVHLTMVVGLAVLSAGDTDGAQTLRRTSGVHKIPLEGAVTQPTTEPNVSAASPKSSRDDNASDSEDRNDESVVPAAAEHPRRDEELSTTLGGGNYHVTGATESEGASPSGTRSEGGAGTAAAGGATPPAPAFFMMGTGAGLFIGGGGSGHALALDDELHHGSSAACTTFNNRPLVPGAFTCDVLEAYYVGGRATEVQPVAASDLAARCVAPGAWLTKRTMEGVYESPNRRYLLVSAEAVCHRFVNRVLHDSLL